jgi:hypothetical protein
VKRLLLIALPCVALSLSACTGRPVNAPQSEEGQAQEKSTGGAANGSLAEGQSPEDRLDVCSLATREEVETALGRKVMEPRRGDELVSRRAGTVTSSCMFGSNEGFVNLNVRRQHPGSTTMWSAPRAFGELKDLIKGSDGQPSGRLEEIEGLGAAAFAETKVETANHETTELRILSQRSILTVRLNGPASTPTLEAAKIIGGKAISRLERSESNAVTPAPDGQATPPKPTVAPDGDKRLKATEESQTERKSGKKADQSADSRTMKAASAKVSKNNSGRDNSSRSKQSKKSVKESAERNKREAQKTLRANPRSRRRS